MAQFFRHIAQAAIAAHDAYMIALVDDTVKIGIIAIGDARIPSGTHKSRSQPVQPCWIVLSRIRIIAKDDPARVQGKASFEVLCIIVKPVTRLTDQPVCGRA